MKKTILIVIAVLITGMAVECDAYNVKMKQETRNDFADKYRLTLPPSSAYVLVNEEQ